MEYISHSSNLEAASSYRAEPATEEAGRAQHNRRTASQRRRGAVGGRASYRAEPATEEAGGAL